MSSDQLLLPFFNVFVAGSAVVLSNAINAAFTIFIIPVLQNVAILFGLATV